MTDLAVIGDRRGPLAKLSDTARTLAAASSTRYVVFATRRVPPGAVKVTVCAVSVSSCESGAASSATNVSEVAPVSVTLAR